MWTVSSTPSRRRPGCSSSSATRPLPIAKYNVDYVDPITSCGAFLAETASYGLIDRDHGLSLVPLWGTLVIESLVPVFLIDPRTRRWGVLFGGAFHYVVSLSPAVGVADFTFLLFALFFLFLPKEQGAEIGRRVVARVAIDRQRAALRPGAAMGVRAASRRPDWERPASRCRPAALAVHHRRRAVVADRHAGGCCAGLAGRVEPIGRPSLPQLLVVLLLLLLSALRPYAGFGTSSAFTMFSGVRTEGPGTTHYFMPSFHLIDSQNDYLIVLELTDGESPVADGARGRTGHRDPAGPGGSGQRRRLRDRRR